MAGETPAAPQGSDLFQREQLLRASDAAERFQAGCLRQREPFEPFSQAIEASLKIPPNHRASWYNLDPSGYPAISREIFNSGQISN